MWDRCFILLSLVKNLPISLPRSLQELNGKANIAQNRSEHIQNREACVLPSRGHLSMPHKALPNISLPTCVRPSWARLQDSSTGRTLNRRLGQHYRSAVCCPCPAPAESDL